MKKLLSLPPNLVDCFYEIEEADPKEWFCTSDPVGSKLGSGGGTAWLLREACKADGQDGFQKWIGCEKRILLHAGGQSRRLPAYAPSGKILTPIPIFRWARGQKLNQNLLSIQLPLYEQIMHKAPASLHTLIASGDVYIRSSKPLPEIPEADVVCFGLWANPELAKNHGVFVSSRKMPEKLDYMLQKPRMETLAELMQTHFFLMDIGVWLLSDKAVNLLMKRSEENGQCKYYDLYSDFGRALGEHPQLHDEELKQLKVAILPLPGGEFYHYGTTKELLSSTLTVQNLIYDQREIIHLKVKPHPCIFTQNSEVKISFTEKNSEVWIENSYVNKNWNISHQHMITGVPENDWELTLLAGVCIDIVPIGGNGFIARPYGYGDAFRGALDNPETIYMQGTFVEWANCRNIYPKDIEGNEDMQTAKIFPICENIVDLGKVIRWMVSEPDDQEGKNIWLKSRRISADEISTYANMQRLYSQRNYFRAKNLSAIARNYEQSVFYQLNLKDAANEFDKMNISMPAPIKENTPLIIRASDSMFRSELHRLRREPFREDSDKAFSLLREGLISSIIVNKQQPHRNVYADQIVWGRSPVRIDLAGGWTDTPPYCLSEGGNVVNLAIELNGQPPLQTYVKPCKDSLIILRSIDLGAMEVVRTYEELAAFNKVGSPFSIPKAALAMAGFLPDFAVEKYHSLEEQLQSFGSGIEVTLLSAVPAGSGLGTSSILASTVLGTLSDFCGLSWDKNEICFRTLVLEQMLTTGGGWQDQYGGVLHGIKLLQTTANFNQTPLVRWLPDYLYTEPEYKKCHLLYYTGITRVAKGILAEVVRSIFLNSTGHLQLLSEMKNHALELYNAIQCNRFEEMGRLIGKTWEQNKRLDSGTNPQSVEMIIRMIQDYCFGYKLPGAGGGGFLYMVAKDAEAAARIKVILQSNPMNPNARFVDMELSDKGLQISRS